MRLWFAGKDRLKAIRSLDVDFALRFAEERGMPFQDGPSEETGEWMTAREIALYTLHKLRVYHGSKQESRESKAWIANRGMRV